MRRQGFSLVEVVLSITLLLLVFGAIIFNFAHLGERSGFDEGARRFESFVRHARAEASLGGRTIRIEFVPAGTSAAPTPSTTSSATGSTTRVQVSVEVDPLNKPGHFSELRGRAWADPELDRLVDVVEVRSLDRLQLAGLHSEDEPGLRPFDFFGDGSSDSVEIILASKDADDRRRIAIRVYGLTGAVSRVEERNAGSAETTQRAGDTGEEGSGRR